LGFDFRTWTMLELLLPLPLILAPASSTVAPLHPTASVWQDRREEFDRRFEAAEDDIDALWELDRWARTYGLEREARQVMRRIIELDPDDEAARERLGHVRVDGRWFTSQRKADRYLEEKAEEEAKARGWVRYDDRWVDPADVPFLEQGLVRAPNGRWVDPEILRRIEEGWVQQDLTWLPPDEQHHIDEGLWKVGDEWLTLEQADAAHAEIGRWWTIPGDRFDLWTTATRERSKQILREVDATWVDLKAFYGIEPAEPPHVIVLRDAKQYRSFANGEGERRPADLGRLSQAYDAFPADGWYDEEGTFLGTGAAHWDPSAGLDPFGRHFVRHAAGLAYAEALDPSPEFTAKIARKPRLLERGVDDFWDEKRIAPVLRFGAASYVDRFFPDRTVLQGGNPDQFRQWAIANIRRRGGFASIDDLLEFELDLRDADSQQESQVLLAQAGLLVWFILSDRVQAVTEAHRAWQAALAADVDLEEATENLFEALRAHEDAYRTFAAAAGGGD
jgi:hypothetical protein